MPFFRNIMCRQSALIRVVLVILLPFIFLAVGCATLNEKALLNPDKLVEKFFDYLHRSQKDDAYYLLGKGLSQTISLEQFESLISVLEEKWGRLDSSQAVVMPFHQRLGESNFIPLGLTAEQIKRYTFEVVFEHAQINCDLTLAFVDNEYKIVWLSFWGSSVYMTPDINDKIQELFSVPVES